jgi:hypothetical protein
MLGKMRLLTAAALLGLVSAAAADPAPSTAPGAAPDAPARPTPFDRGRVHLGLGGGSQDSLGFHYFAISGGVGYYVLDGLELGLHGIHEFGDGPRIDLLSPSLRYVAQPLVGKWPLIPYVGVFYNHWFIADVPDQDAVGARAGMLFIRGAIVLGLGVVYEQLVSTCATDCSSVYPDFTIALAL